MDGGGGGSHNDGDGTMGYGGEGQTKRWGQNNELWRGWLDETVSYGGEAGTRQQI